MGTFAAVTTAQSAYGQDHKKTTDDGPPRYEGPVQVVSVTPFGIFWLNSANAEYERRVHRRISVGISLTYWGDVVDDDFDHMISGVFLVRYFPQGRAPEGVYFDLRTGVNRLDDPATSQLLPSLGYQLGYNWLLGEDDHFQIGFGFGGSRLVGRSEPIPNFKLNVGYAF